MKDISIRDLIDLVISEVPDAETRIQRMYEWHFERDITISKWVLGLAVSLLVSVLVASFKTDLNLEWWKIYGVVFCAFATVTYGIYRLWQIRSIHRQFISSLKLFCELRKIRLFLIRYRGRR